MNNINDSFIRLSEQIKELNDELVYSFNSESHEQTRTKLADIGERLEQLRERHAYLKQRYEFLRNQQ